MDSSTDVPDTTWESLVRPDRQVNLVAPGLSVDAWYCEPTAQLEPLPAVLLCDMPVMDETDLGAVLGPLARRLGGDGIASLRFRHRQPQSSDESGASGAAETMSRLIRAGLEFLSLQPGVDSRSLGVAGVGLGGAATVLSCAGDPRVRCLALLAAALCPDPAGRREDRRWWHVPWRPDPRRGSHEVPLWKPNDLERSLRSCRSPLLVVHGMADRVVPFDDACRMVEMAQAAGWPVRFVSIEGGDHSFSHAFCRECAIEESGSWFASILGKEHGSSW